MLYLKQSTASQSVLLGPFVDDTDGATAETALTIANTDIRLSKNGGNMAAKTSGGGTHDENGWYTITLDATDTNTVGRLQVSCKVAGALAVFAEFQVLEEAVYDAYFASSATGLPSGIATSSAQTTAQNDLDILTGSDGVTLATAQGNYAPAVAGDSMALTAAAVDAVWDEVITGAQHNVNNSAAKFLRESAEGVGVTGTAQSATSTSITLASGAVSATNIFNGEVIFIIEGTGTGQARIITSSTITTDVCNVLSAWTTTPDSTSVYSIRPGDANLAAIQLSGTPVTNLAADYDGTGYNKSNSTIGTTTTLTGHTAQTGDTYALANGATGFAAIDTVVDAVKVKTDQMVFTKANELDVNTQSINGASVVGDGNATPWDGA